MSIRTDMAAESFSQAGGAEKLQGVKVKNKVIENARLKVTDITIETQEAAEKLGRPVGRYITLTATDSTFDMYSDSFRERAEVIAKAIRELCGGCERFLAVGLGNYALTSDAVGPLTAEKIFATRHIKSLAKEIDTIEKEIDNRIAEGFKDHISDFVDCKNLYSGDCAVFAVSH